MINPGFPPGSKFRIPFSIYREASLDDGAVITDGALPLFYVTAIQASIHVPRQGMLFKILTNGVSWPNEKGRHSSSEQTPAISDVLTIPVHTQLQSVLDLGCNPLKRATLCVRVDIIAHFFPVKKFILIKFTQIFLPLKIKTSVGW